MIEFNGTTYFTDDELRCNGSGLLILADGFAEQLLALRLAWNKAMTVTSCCRSEEYNREVGGAPDSFHITDGDLGTCAIDIAINGGYERRLLTELALAMGWSVGIPASSRGFVHLDRRTDYNYEPMMFGY